MPRIQWRHREELLYFGARSKLYFFPCCALDGRVPIPWQDVLLLRLLPNFLWVRFPGANHRQTKMSRESKRERKRKKKGSEVTSGAMYLLGKWDGGRLLLQERRLYYYTGYGHSITRGNNMLLMCLAHLFTSSRAASMSFERYFSFLVTSLSISRFFSWQLSLLSAQLSSGRRNALSSR